MKQQDFKDVEARAAIIQNCDLAIFYLSGASRRSRRWSRFPHRSGLARRTKFAWSSSSKAASFALVIDRQHAKAKVVAAPHQMRLFLIFDLELNLLTGPKRGEQRVKQVSLCVPPFILFLTNYWGIIGQRHQRRGSGRVEA